MKQEAFIIMAMVFISNFLLSVAVLLQESFIPDFLNLNKEQSCNPLLHGLFLDHDIIFYF